MSYHDKKIQVEAATLDFSKAFDVVPHERPLGKIEHYGIRGDTLRWIRSFLTGWNQSVMVDGTRSNKVQVLSGVPQGTVLGPLLFLLYINDLPDHVSSQVRLFTDDCLLYRPVKSIQDQIQLQEDLRTLTEWANTWGMTFNPSKCYILTTSQSKKITTFLYQLCGCVLSKAPNCKYLGITLSDDLQWSTHISNICKSASRSLGFLRRNLRRCPTELRELAYFALVRSKLEYSCAVWDPHLTKDKDLLAGIQ